MERGKPNGFTTLTNYLIPTWAIGLTLVCASLMVGHWVALPKPDVGSIYPIGPPVQTASNQTDRECDSLRVTHFIYLDCPCSQRVLGHLMQRGPVAGICEQIVLIGDDELESSAEVGKTFPVSIVPADELTSKYGIESAPLMIVTNCDNVVKYSGGYTARKQGLDYQDVSIIGRVQKGVPVESLPLYGCPVSSRLKKIVDPFGLR